MKERNEKMILKKGEEKIMKRKNTKEREGKKERNFPTFLIFDCWKSPIKPRAIDLLTHWN